jgi:hypothetical protein
MSCIPRGSHIPLDFSPFRHKSRKPLLCCLRIRNLKPDVTVAGIAEKITEWKMGDIALEGTVVFDLNGSDLHASASPK